MKEFLGYLKKFWWLFAISILIDFFWLEAYVYPTLTFDLSVGLDPIVWIRVFLKQIPFMIGFYFVFFRPNREKLFKKENTNPKN